MKRRFDSISILRVLACIGIFVCHIAPVSGASGIAARIANTGASGVYLFFILSGFLLAGEGAFREDRLSPETYVRFAGKRLCRLLPMYYLVMAAQAAVHSFILRDVPPDPGHLYWLRYIFLTNAVLPAPDNFWGNLGATWTVSLFVVSSLLAPFALRWISGGRRTGTAAGSGDTGNPGVHGRERNRKVKRAAVLYIALLLLAGFRERFSVSGTFMCFLYLHYFALGTLIREITESSGEDRIKAQHARSIRQAAAYAGTVVPGAALLLIFFGSIGHFTLVSWGFGLIVLVTLPFSVRNEHSLLFKALTLLDRHSYAVYLVHAAVAEWLYMGKSHIALSGPAVWGAAAVCTIIGTALVTFCEAHLQYLYRPDHGHRAG